MKSSRINRRKRLGVALPLLALCMFPMMGMLALAIDLGMMTIARSEAQDLADMSAMVGARTINGQEDEQWGIPQIPVNIDESSSKSLILNSFVTTSQVTHELGEYKYNNAADIADARFEGTVGLEPEDRPTLITAEVVAQVPTFFGAVLGSNQFNISTNATAVHRPRDVAIIMDYSLSMRFGSNLVGQTSYNQPIAKVVSSDTLVPNFGHYSSASIHAKMLNDGSAYIRPDTAEVYGISNVTAPSGSGPAIVGDFRNVGSAEVAFTPEPASYTTDPAGDIPLRKNLNDPASNYAFTVYDLLGMGGGQDPKLRTGGASHPQAQDWETYGYDWTLLNTGGFQGYTMGPGYMGKTFFIWPPDPRVNHDWRRKFFTYPGLSNDDFNSRLFDGNERFDDNGNDTYLINYTNIIQWIKNTGTNPFPESMRCGRIIYYTQIPDNIPASGGDDNQRFWRQYIDSVIGKEGHSTNDRYGRRACGYGPDETWNTGSLPTNIYSKGSGADASYMDYRDNPRRPLLHMWFGPMTMLDFIYREFGMPGACHEAQLWQTKVGMAAALTDIQRNHPNDRLALVYFSSRNLHSRALAPLGIMYDRMTEALWYPRDTLPTDPVASTVTCWESSKRGHAGEVPRADGGTCPAEGFMLAFNQFSSNTNIADDYSDEPYGTRGGLGRRRSQKMCIFMTDGYPTQNRAGSLGGTTPSQKYYHSFYNGGGSGGDAAVAIVTQMCALEDAGGYATPARPVKVHAIAFGDLFEEDTARADNSKAFLLKVQQVGSTSPSGASSLPDYKIITGPYESRISALEEALTKIMQDGVQVALIE